MSVPTKSSGIKISELGKNVLILAENGISISEIVNILHKKYNSKRTCWAAVSRICKNLSQKSLLELYKKNNRVEYIQTTLQGKKLIRDICDDLEIISFGHEIEQFQKMSRIIKEQSNYSSNPMNLINNNEIKKLILQILAKYGELSRSSLARCLELDEKILSEILNSMINSSLILKLRSQNNPNIIKYQLNWKYLFLPIKNICDKNTNGV